jgi:hypothetical protein
MKKTLLFLPLLLICLGFIAESQQDFVVNDTTLNLGTATVYWSGGSGNLDIPAGGQYSLTAGGDPTAITLNGTTVNKPNHGPVSVAGTSVYVTWPETNEIEIATHLITNSPAQ